MSARVLNPAMMTEMSRNLAGGRATPNRAALARVRRDLFGPVDHAAAQALAERELRTQAILDAEKWGFDFHLGIPRSNARYEWEVVSEKDIVPEPYALRGMPYLRKHAPGTPRKSQDQQLTLSIPRSSPVQEPTSADAAARPVVDLQKSERTPPQEPRVPEIGESTPNQQTTTTTTTTNVDLENRNKYAEPTTPVLPVSARKQSIITDFMKSRKRVRTVNGSAKGMIEPPEKMARNAGQIRS